MFQRPTTDGRSSITRHARASRNWSRTGSVWRNVERTRSVGGGAGSASAMTSAGRAASDQVGWALYPFLYTRYWRLPSLIIVSSFSWAVCCEGPGTFNSHVTVQDGRFHGEMVASMIASIYNMNLYWIFISPRRQTNKIIIQFKQRKTCTLK